MRVAGQRLARRPQRFRRNAGHRLGLRELDGLLGRAHPLWASAAQTHPAACENQAARPTADRAPPNSSS